MFLVEPESGHQCHYGSAGALGAAIRRGELGPRARIFHRSAQRWLPITVHPEYRKVELAREEAYEQQWRARPYTFLAERPGEAFHPDSFAPDTFRPIPARSSATMVLIPDGDQRFWRRVLRRLLPFG
jgi:hypothetical protein